MTGAKEKVLIIGAGPHARVIADILSYDATKEVVGYLDKDSSRTGTCIHGVPVVGDDSYLDDPKKRKTFDSVIMGLGGNLLPQRSLLDKKIKGLQLKTAKAIHPQATVARSATISEGTVVMAGAIINPGAVIKENCVVNTGAIVDHDCIIEEGTFVQPGAVLAGNVHVGKDSTIGMGAKILETRTIGENSIIGAGSVVTKDVPSHVVMVGIPARKHRDNR